MSALKAAAYGATRCGAGISSQTISGRSDAARNWSSAVAKTFGGASSSFGATIP
jgi:hypothetical protein